MPYHQKPKQSEPLGSFNKTKLQQSDENILYNSQSGLRIDQVWSMAVEVNSQPHSTNANHFPLDSTLKDTAGNGSSGMGQSAPQISSVVDNTSQKARLESRKRKAARKAYRQSDKGKAYLKAYQEAYYEVFNKTGDRKQAKIAGKQATACMRKKIGKKIGHP